MKKPSSNLLMNNAAKRVLVKSLLEVNPRSTLLFLACLYVVGLATAYLTLVAPGKSYISIWLNDIMGLLDIANRIHLGQRPYQDFSLVYGPLLAFIPGLGLNLGLEAGSVFGFQALVVSAVLLGCCMVVLPRRFTAASAGLVFGVIWLLAAAPAGELHSFGHVTWGTFYNRQGWAATILTVLFYVQPERVGPHDKWWDSLALAVLLLFHIYTKFTFGVVAAAFVVANAAVSAYNRQVTLRSLLVTAAVAGLLEAGFHFHALYLHDIVEQVGMAARDRTATAQAAVVLANNAARIVGCVCAVLLAWHAGRRSVFDGLYAAGVVLAAVFLRLGVGANPVYGVILVLAVFVSLSELSRRSEAGEAPGSGPVTMRARGARHVASLGCLVLAGSFVALDVAKMLVDWQVFVVKVHSREPLPDTPRRLASLLVPNPVQKWSTEAGTSEYMQTVVDGTQLLLSLNQPDRSVLTLDMVNPFPYAAGMQPPVHGRPLFWLNGPFTADSTRVPSAQQFVGQADYVMVPRKPYDKIQDDNMQRLYGPFLHQHYVPLKESVYWQLWARSVDKASTTAADAPSLSN